MQYGSSDWQPWVIGDEEEAIKHIKAACVLTCLMSCSRLYDADLLKLRGCKTISYEAGIQTFDTADVRVFELLQSHGR